MSGSVPTGIFGQYWLEQLHRKNLRYHKYKYDPFPMRKTGARRDLLCPICHRDVDLLAPVSPFKVSWEGIVKLHPQPQMRIKGLYVNRKGEVIDVAVPPSKFNRQVIVPYIDKEGFICPVTGKKSHRYYIVQNAQVCRKCIWHRLGQKKGKLKVDGETIEY